MHAIDLTSVAVCIHTYSELSVYHWFDVSVSSHIFVQLEEFSTRQTGKSVLVARAEGNESVTSSMHDDVTPTNINTVTSRSKTSVQVIVATTLQVPRDLAPPP